MGMFDNIKKLINNIKELKTEEYKEYKKSKEYVQKEINRFQGYVDNYSSKLEEYKKQNEPIDSPAYKTTFAELQRWQYSLAEEKRTLPFVRPNTNKDIEYRNRQMDEFVQKLKAVTSDKLDLRFHGTPIYFAEDIIRSGNISSSADRFDGYMKSTDLSGEISASTIDSLSRTIDFFSDMTSYHRNLPCGCIFALIPKDKEDASIGHDIMKSVSFDKNPEQLYGIFTTPENVPNVQKWMEECGYCKDKVYTFDEFINVVEKDSQRLEQKAQKELESKNKDSSRIIIDQEKIFEDAKTERDNLIESPNIDEISQDVI